MSSLSDRRVRFDTASLLAAGVILCVVVALATTAFLPDRYVFNTPSLAIQFGFLAILGVRYSLGFAHNMAGDIALGIVSVTSAWLLIAVAHSYPGDATTGFWALVVALWLSFWLFVERLAAWSLPNPTLARLVNLAIPVLFGATFLILWELGVTGAGVPRVLLPAPSEIWIRLTTSVPTLWADFQQTFLKAVLIGYAIGCGSAFVVAILVDRVPFLRRGLLPIGNLVSALPIIGVAPIMVMWFGFDWPSKAAVVIIMTFFPMLVNTVSGLAETDAMQRDLMRTYASNYWQTLFKLRLPMAMPFIFNALKINSTLALIGAIVAEFFGTPIVGMGFRISTEVGRMNVDMVWAEIAVAALAGSLFYGFVALLERAVTFWHPSMRAKM
ncbi:binding-protein-dependent transport systems inner membrane component [Roseibium sp. TrichSKD4]|uniref:ABC transporter permease n=1 Tax=Roseibium sp. TrichSKD4 TaxID=744980 RepID=UPI0001E56213|nr:ABC transporter permease [Roseibium sp. TrichSKD4]EFO33754.1 binding-protein-dependent transport systems inner membrane component [Roseibium sp. TrichSKD4]